MKMNLFRKRPISLVLGSALSLAILPTQAGDYDQIDLSSLQGESLILDGDHVAHTGDGAAIKVKGEKNELQGHGLDVRVIADSSNSAAVGVQVLTGGRAKLERSTVIANGYYADGASSSGTGSLLQLNDTDVITNGGRGRGVVVDAGGVTELTGGTINTSGMIADALSASGTGSTLRVSGVTLSTFGNSASAIRAQSGARVELEQSTAITYGQYAPAFSIGGEGTVVHADGVTVESHKAQGVDIEGGLLIFSNGSLKARGDGILFRPAYQQPGGRGIVRHSQVTSEEGNGINLNASGSTAELDDVHVSAYGDYGSAIWMPGSDTRAEVKNSTLETWGSRAAAVDNRAGVFQMKGGTVTTHGDGAHALYASTDVIGAADGPSAEFDVRQVAIETFGRGSVGAMARVPGTTVSVTDSHILTHGDNSHGLSAYEGGSVQATDTEVITQGRSAYGLSLGNNASGSLHGVHLQTNAEKAYGIVSLATDAGLNNRLEITDSLVETHDSAALLVNGGSLTARLTNSSLIARSGGEPGVALQLTDRSDGVMAEHVILDSEQSLIGGDVQVDGGSLHLNLHSQSRLDGAFRDYRQSAMLDIDASSGWMMRGDSSVGSLSNDGVVEFSALGEDFMRLSVAGDLAGSGQYSMNTNLGEQRGDRLVVQGRVTGSNRILVRNSGTEPAAGRQSLTLVQSGGGPGSFSLANRGAVVDAGTYRYELRRDDRTSGNGTDVSDWSLVNVGRTEPSPGPSEPGEPGGPGEPSEPSEPSGPSIPPAPLPKPSANNLSTAASAAINSSALATLRVTWDAERSSLVQRMGDLREDDRRQGVWMRGYGQRQLLDNGVGRDFSQNVNGMQIGADTRLASAGAAVILGGLMGYSQTDRRFKGEGDGKLDSYHLGVYGTYLDDSGWYVDSLLTLNHWSTRFEVQASDGAKVSGHSRSHGAGLSLEAGKRFTLDDGWFVEPQAQLSVLYAAGDRYRLSNGMRVDAGDGVASQVRGGALLGRRLSLEGGAILQPYLKAGWTQDISARNRVKTNDISSHPDGNGGGWYAGAGMTGSLGGGQYLYADVETGDSSTLERPWAVNLGYRLSW